MQLLLFSIVAICIAGSMTQEIAIGTDYIRAHFNDSIAAASAINTQGPGEPEDGSIIIVDVDDGHGSLISDSASSTTTTTTTIAPNIDDISSLEKGSNNINTNYDHEHKYHHEHASTITIDVHNILDIFKQLLQASEQRIIAAVQPNQASNPAPVLKSYRTADR